MAQCLVEVYLSLAANDEIVGEALQSADFAGRGAFGGEKDDGREPVAKDCSAGIDGSGAAGDDAKVEFGEAAAEPEALVARPAGTEPCLCFLDRAGAGHHGVSRGAQFVEMSQVARAAESGDGPVGGSDLAIGG